MGVLYFGHNLDTPSQLWMRRMLEAVADEGLQAFFGHGGRIRIVVDAELTQADVDEVRRGAAVGGDESLRSVVKAQVEHAVLRAELPGSTERKAPRLSMRTMAPVSRR